MSRNLLAALALAVLSLAVAAPAHAVLITVNFTVTGAAADPLHAGETANGSFSFDSSIIPGTLPGGATAPAVTNLDFTWDGTQWTDANTDFIQPLNFDSGGNLVNWGLGGNPSGAGALSGNPAGPDDIGLASFVSQFSYHTLGSSFVYTGSLTWSADYGTGGGAAPEPGTLAMFAPGLLALGLVRRRKS